MLPINWQRDVDQPRLHGTGVGKRQPVGGLLPPRLVGINGVLLECSPVHLHIVSGAFPATRTALGSWDRDRRALKT